MINIEISSEELKRKYKQINHCLYHSSRNTVIKDCTLSGNTPDFLHERLTYMASNTYTNGYTHPLSLLLHNGIAYGYEMVYLNHYIDIGEYISNRSCSRIPYEVKKIILLDLLKNLKQINKHYIISDINVYNIMFNAKGDSMFIDWENGYPINSPLPPLEMYDTTFIKNGVQSESLKIYLCALSLLYEIDFGQLFRYMEYDRFCKMISEIEINPIICKFLEDLTYEFNINSNRTPYFDEYLNCVRNITKKDISRVKKLALKEYYNDTLNVLKYTI